MIVGLEGIWIKVYTRRTDIFSDARCAILWRSAFCCSSLLMRISWLATIRRQAGRIFRLATIRNSFRWFADDELRKKPVNPVPSTIRWIQANPVTRPRRGANMQRGCWWVKTRRIFSTMSYQKVRTTSNSALVIPRFLLQSIRIFWVYRALLITGGGLFSEFVFLCDFQKQSGVSTCADFCKIMSLYSH